MTHSMLSHCNGFGLASSGSFFISDTLFIHFLIWPFTNSIVVRHCCYCALKICDGTAAPVSPHKSYFARCSLVHGGGGGGQNAKCQDDKCFHNQVGTLCFYLRAKQQQQCRQGNAATCNKPVRKPCDSFSQVR